MLPPKIFYGSQPAENTKNENRLATARHYLWPHAGLRPVVSDSRNVEEADHRGATASAKPMVCPDALQRTPESAINGQLDGMAEPYPEIHCPSSDEILYHRGG